jgi:hypothetical protein
MSQPMKTAQNADNAWEDRYDQEREKIADLSFEEARRRAEVLLADPRKFECVAAAANEPISIFAPGLQSLFSRFESIHVVGDEAYLCRQEIELFDWDGNGLSWGRPLWKIGAAHGHSLTLVTPDDERVYDMDEDELGEPFPSIYHWLLWVSAVASDFGVPREAASDELTKPGKRIVSKSTFIAKGL